MAGVYGILVSIKTANLPHAGTDASVYLGLASREFRLVSAGAKDFERNATTTMRLGEPPVAGGTPLHPDSASLNDPRDPGLTDGFLPLASDANNPSTYGAYIRFERGPDLTVDELLKIGKSGGDLVSAILKRLQWCIDWVDVKAYVGNPDISPAYQVYKFSRMLLTKGHLDGGHLWLGVSAGNMVWLSFDGIDHGGDAPTPGAPKPGAPGSSPSGAPTPGAPKPPA